MTKFWEETGTALSTRLFAAGAAALVFWVWLLTVWSIREGGWSYARQVMQPLMDEKDVAPLLVLAVLAVIVVSASTIVVDRLTLPTLRALEGYWPSLFEGLRAGRVAHWQTKLEALTVLPAGASGPVRLTTAQVRGWRFPSTDDVMPTRVGNIIRGGERRPAYWYGLDSVILWPQLWLVLPTQARGDLTSARQQLDRAVAGLIWAVIACALTALWLPALLPGVVSSWVIWRWWVPSAAETYATLVAAVFDVYRFDLYDALHYPRPNGPADEVESGRALTSSLWSNPGPWPVKYTTDLSSLGEGAAAHAAKETPVEL